MDEDKRHDASAGVAPDWQPEPSYHRLALHAWEMGQVLHPHQFVAQEQALLEHVGLRAQLTGLPSHGVALLRCSESQLAGGDLSISAVTVVLRSGLMIDCPGNAVLTGRKLSLPARPAGPVSVYLHVRKERRSGGARDLSRYADDEPEVKRTIYQVEISTEPSLENELDSMKLAELRFGDGAWALAPWVPPLLRIGVATTPFLRDTMEQVVRAIDAFESELGRRAADAVAGADQLAEVRRVLSSVYRVRAMLADHGYGAATQTVALHPYHLFAALRDFYLDAVMLQGKAREAWPLRYQHDKLSDCFAELASGLARGLSAPAVVSLRLPFRRSEGWFITERFPDELRRAHAVFLLLERASQAHLPEDAGAPPLDGLKLASPQRVDEVYRKALTGVPWEPIPSLGFSQTFGQRATVLKLDSKSREWNLALAEASLCFAVLPGLEGFSAALFWQSPSHG